MTDLFMGIIAGAVLVMAVLQVAVAIMALKATKQLGRVTARLEQDIRPIVTNLQAITTEAARATAIAAAQVERADKLFGDLAARVEQTMVSVQATVTGATRGGAWLAAIRAAMAALRDLRSPVPRRPAHAEEEDALFIG